MMPADKPIQSFYNPKAAICYGCGMNNPDGLHIQTYWNGEEGICHFTPLPEHTAFPGYVYGGLLARHHAAGMKFEVLRLPKE
jgi:hypothetical protein